MEQKDPIRSAAVVEFYHYQDQKTLIGLNDDLQLAFGDGKTWKWDPKPLNVWPADSDPEIGPTQRKIERAFRQGDQIIVVIDNERDGDNWRGMVILDSEDPRRVLGQIEKLEEERQLATQVQGQVDAEVSLCRYADNPIISPRPAYAWEAMTTLNPAAFVLDDRVHILYRAQGHDYISHLGYAISGDGYTVTHRFDDPIFTDKTLEQAAISGEAVAYGSGGGLGGIEDPRVTVLEDRVHMAYVAYDGYSPPRLAYSSIAVEDFRKQNWRWSIPQYMSPPGMVDKSGAIFPKKINGRYAILHRIFPDIQIDYRDELVFGPGHYLKVDGVIKARQSGWDSRKIGCGPPPMWTEHGWLMIYYGVDDRHAVEYRIGAMLLDHDDPMKVILRSETPILSPERLYELSGFKPGILYPCGSVIKDNQLFVYYGAADQHVCLATADLNEFIDQLRHEKEVSLSLAKIVNHNSHAMGSDQ